MRSVGRVLNFDFKKVLKSGETPLFIVVLLLRLHAYRLLIL